MALPYSILKQLWDGGYGGKVIRVPRISQKRLLKVRVDDLLSEVEEIYEKTMMTFVLEKRGRSNFNRSFGLLRLCRRFHLELEEARTVRKRAYSRWSHWILTREGARLSTVDAFGQNGDGRRVYLDIRRSVRKGEGTVEGSRKELEQLASDSVRTVTWR